MAGQNAAPSYRQKADRSPTIRRIRPCGAERLRCDPVLHFAAYALIATATKTAQSVIAGLLGQRTYRLKGRRAQKCAALWRCRTALDALRSSHEQSSGSGVRRRDYTRYQDIGVSDEMMRDVGKSLKPGTSALFVLVRRATVDKVLDGLKAFAGKGKVFQSSLSKDDEATLREALEKAA